MIEKSRPSSVLMTVQQFSEKHPSFPQGALRNLIFNASPRRSSTGRIGGNGLDVALIRIGRKLLINEAGFFEWVENEQRRDRHVKAVGGGK